MIIADRSDINTLPLSLKYLIEKLDERIDFKPSDIVELLTEADVKEEDINDWTDFEHDPRENYGRSLLYSNEHCEILIISWRPGDFSAIHDHGIASYGAVKVFGPLEHAVFQFDHSGLSTVKRELMRALGIFPVDGKIIHQMGNPSDKKILSLHIYGVKKKAKNVTAETRIYNPEKACIQISNGGAFYELDDADILKEEKGLVSGLPTRIGHMILLLEFTVRNQMNERKSEILRFFDEPNLRPLVSAYHQSNKYNELLLCQELERVSEVFEKMRLSADHIHDILAELEA